MDAKSDTAPTNDKSPAEPAACDGSSPEQSAEDAICDCTACTSCEYGPEAACAAREAIIAAHGFAMEFVASDDTTFAYSVGMQESYGLPEFVVVGRFSPGALQTVCTGVSRVARESPDLLRGNQHEIVGVVRIQTKSGIVDAPVGYRSLGPEHLAQDAEFPLTANIERYGLGNFRAMQLVIPDPNGRLPWHAGFDEGWRVLDLQRELWLPD